MHHVNFATQISLKVLLGRAIRVRQIRNGIELAPLFEDNSYDFNYQAIKYTGQPRKVMPVRSIRILLEKMFQLYNLS